MRRIARQLSSSSTMITRTITGRGVGSLKRTKSSDDALLSILHNKKVIFTITYDKNSDSTKQEFQTVVDCIHSIFPGSDVIENAVDGVVSTDGEGQSTTTKGSDISSEMNMNQQQQQYEHPADTVTISAEVMLNDYEEEEEDDNDANNETIPYLVWTGKQSHLQRKNSVERTKLIKEIKDCLKLFIEELTQD